MFPFRRLFIIPPLAAIAIVVAVALPSLAAPELGPAQVLELGPASTVTTNADGCTVTTYTQGGQSSRAVDCPTETTTPTPEAPLPPTRAVRVAAGDTLWSLAATHAGSGHCWPHIAAHNGISNPRALPVGVVLTIPWGC